MNRTLSAPKAAERTHDLAFPGAWPGAWCIDDEEAASVQDVLEAQSLFRHYGPKVLGKARAFEQAFSAKMGVPYTLGVSSGTGALVVGLVGMGVGHDDEVIMPAFTWIANPCAAVLVGAVPVLAEADASLNLDPAEIERLITPRTKAVMVVHTSGVPADMGRILHIARKHGLKVIEDCAQSCGASFGGRRVGSLGDAGAFSFQTNKIITAGEGGALTTADPVLYERAIRYHDLGGLREQFGIQAQGTGFFGSNYRMNEMTGAVALVQLEKLDGIVAAMRENKAAIEEGIRGLPGLELRASPDPKGDAAATLSFYAPDAATADRLAKALSAERVPCGKYYGGKTLYELWPDHFNTWLAERRARGARLPAQEFRKGLCPRTEDLLSRALSLPMTPNLTREHVAKAVDAICRAWRLA